MSKKSPEDVVNELFAEPDKRMFSDKGLRIATARIGQRMSPEVIEQIQAAKKLNPRKTVWTAAAKEAQSRRKLGVKRPPRTAEHTERLASTLKGRQYSDAHKANIAASVKSQIANAPKVTCPHCGKTLDQRSIKRYHLDKCKALLS